MNPQNKIAQRLRALHQPGNPLILTNTYDAPTATIIASLPTAHAVATASFAIASTLGVDDSSLTSSQNLSALNSIASAVRAVNPSKPVTVDLQDGYGTLVELTATVKEVVELGAVGCNLEDLNNATGQLRPLDDAVARVKTVVEAATEAGVPDFVVNARTDVLYQDGATIDDASDEIRVLVRELGGMVNVKMNLRDGFLGVEEIRDLGVARVSVGPELWKAAMMAFKKNAEMLLGPF
ncbi:Pyruvate/Phosphoenolpyruvate kinase [Penicillium cinerascens]|uniref:Pyruvate/Phosphoenolpyruvate kinase n=1 Tax=Penicillium cinerascens TaxID=70096 RepID=A0A9W9NAL2_9EURO|nr:Pyruvate/Phosphoenolpyruvate kinase [Penicillium cinerascens]KAJ5216256.1 Pyruvate/Phosphoenolpyruvate kinase [Penicillium cinerascens]